jgi:uncharacterized integral membrane protein
VSEGVHEVQHESRFAPLLHGRVIAAVVAVVLFIVFVLENRRTVRVDLFFWHANTSIAWALIVAGILGLIAGLLFPRLRRLL